MTLMMAVVNAPLGGTIDFVIPISVGSDVTFLCFNLFVLVGDRCVGGDSAGHRVNGWSCEVGGGVIKNTT